VLRFWRRNHAHIIGMPVLHTISEGQEPSSSVSDTHTPPRRQRRIIASTSDPLFHPRTDDRPTSTYILPPPPSRIGRGSVFDTMSTAQQPVSAFAMQFITRDPPPHLPQVPSILPFDFYLPPSVSSPAPPPIQPSSWFQSAPPYHTNPPAPPTASHLPRSTLSGSATSDSTESPWSSYTPVSLAETPSVYLHRRSGNVQAQAHPAQPQPANSVAEVRFSSVLPPFWPNPEPEQSASGPNRTRTRTEPERTGNSEQRTRTFLFQTEPEQNRTELLVRFGRFGFAEEVQNRTSATLPAKRAAQPVQTPPAQPVQPLMGQPMRPGPSPLRTPFRPNHQDRGNPAEHWERSDHYQYAQPAAPPVPAPPKPLPQPTITHIPILKTRQDFPAWESAVILSIRHLDLFGHLLDPRTPVTTWEDRPLPPPHWPANPTVEDVYAARRWSLDDTTVCFILCGRLGDQARALLPPASSPAHLRTAFVIYSKLVQFYGAWDYQECADMLDSLILLRCESGPGKVHEYISKWTAAVTLAVSQESAGDVRKLISRMIRNLPSGHVFGSLVSGLSDRLRGVHVDDSDAFFKACEDVLAQEKAFRPSSSLVPSANRTRPPSSSRLAATGTTTTADSGAVPSSSKPPPRDRDAICSNCNISGHSIATCFKPGGGMEKRKTNAKAFVAEVMESYKSLHQENIQNVFGVFVFDTASQIQFLEALVSSFQTSPRTTQTYPKRPRTLILSGTPPIGSFPPSCEPPISVDIAPIATPKTDVESPLGVDMVAVMVVTRGGRSGVRDKGMIEARRGHPKESEEREQIIHAPFDIEVISNSAETRVAPSRAAVDACAALLLPWDMAGPHCLWTADSQSGLILRHESRCHHRNDHFEHGEEGFEQPAQGGQITLRIASIFAVWSMTLRPTKRYYDARS
ncbi:hypothetical protein CPC08DRAFT_729812, partial [Agrocybe pediades]